MIQLSTDRRVISQVLAASITPKEVRNSHKRKVVRLPSMVLTGVYVKLKRNFRGVVGMRGLSIGSHFRLKTVAARNEPWKRAFTIPETNSKST